mgnify:CR=1 FL=1
MSSTHGQWWNRRLREDNRENSVWKCGSDEAELVSEQSRVGRKPIRPLAGVGLSFFLSLTNKDDRPGDRCLVVGSDP